MEVKDAPSTDRRIHLLPFLFALLHWASFHPLDLGFLGWFALIPLLVYAKRARGKKAFFIAWLAGAAAFSAGFYWSHYTVPWAGPSFLGVYNGLYIPVFVLLVRRTSVAWAPVHWVALEYIRGSLFTGLPWLLLGYTQHQAGVLLQSADIAGVWGVSGLLAFVSAALVDGRRAMRWGAAVLVAAAAVYGGVRLGTITLEEGPKLTIIQPNIPQDLKLLSLENEMTALDNYRTHVRLTAEAVGEKPDLIIWPEAAVYWGIFWLPKSEGWVENEWYRRMMGPADEAGAPLLTGVLVTDVEHRDGRPRMTNFYNSAVLVHPGGRMDGRYDKVHLVPFGEYTPLKETFPGFWAWIKETSNLVLPDTTRGAGFRVWDLDGRKFGPQICFEAIFPEISREIAGKGAQFTVNISNDGWFKDSAELDQMLAMARFRAVESRIHMVRATNTGISAFIDPTGEIQAMIPGKEVAGTLTARIRVTSASSPYRVLGDWMPWMSVAASLSLLGLCIFVDRNKGPS